MRSKTSCQTEKMTGHAEEQTSFDVPSGSQVQSTGGSGPFVSRVQWQDEKGATTTWESRRARREGYIETFVGGVVRRIRVRPAVAIRLIRCNAVAALAFVVGGALFTIGALLIQFSTASADTINIVFLVGGVFFSLGGYASIVLEVNSPRTIGADGLLDAGRWRWWAYEPLRPGWTSAFVLFLGTLAFAVSLVDVFIDNLSLKQDNHLVWAPEMLGCVLFLVSGHLAIVEICHGRFRFIPHSLGWWIVAVNQLGSVLFFLSGVGAYLRPATGDVVSQQIIVWGTAIGAFCFSAAGVAQLFERPPSPSKKPAEPVKAVSSPV